MKLPSREKSYVPTRKLVDYLLSESHPVGRSKAKYLRAGGFDESFDESNVQLLEEGLIGIARSEEVMETEPTPHGTKYVIGGELLTPAGDSRRLRTVWVIEPGDDRPRFVTAYPENA